MMAYASPSVRGALRVARRLRVRGAAAASSSLRLGAMLALVGGIAALASPTTAQAQKNKGKPCDVQNDNSSEALAGRLFLARATDPKSKDTAQKDSALKQAVGAVGGKFNPNKDFGRDFLLAEALVLQAANPNNPVEGPRSQFGFKNDQNPTGQVNILATADTLLNAMVQGRPECEELADNIRLQAYPAITNAAITALGQSNYGRADTLAQRAEMIYKKSPYVYNVLAGVAVRQNNFPTALTNYQKVIQLSGDSANYKALKNGAYYNTAVVKTSMAEGASGADKKALSDSAVAAWKTVQAADPSNPNGQAGLTHALQISGDSAAAAGLYTDMVNNPSKYSSLQLFQSAIAANNAKDETDAFKLFQAGLQQNPYFRDALYYVANTQFNNGQTDSLMPTVKRLLSVDPNNPDDYRLLAGAYQLRQREAKDVKMKRAYGDSIMSALNKYEKPPVRLTVTKFANDGSKIDIGGRIENMTDSSQTYTPKFQFLDASGNVVGSADAPAVTVPAKSAGTFDVAANVSNAVAYKYAPLR